MTPTEIDQTTRLLGQATNTLADRLAEPGKMAFTAMVHKIAVEGIGDLVIAAIVLVLALACGRLSLVALGDTKNDGASAGCVLAVGAICIFLGSAFIFQQGLMEVMAPDGWPSSGSSRGFTRDRHRVRTGRLGDCHHRNNRNKLTGNDCDNDS